MNPIETWNKAWRGLHPELEGIEMTDENGWLPKYNKWIAKKMTKICYQVNKENENLQSRVAPTSDAYYRFFIKNNPWKSCQFSLKPLN